MRDTRTLISLATQPDGPLADKQEAFGEIVTRFQDMAYGCAYAVLNDFYLAQDAAQEAFITAWQKLDQLREPDAFPGWFRRIVLTECNRLTRGKRLQFVPLDAGTIVPSAEIDPQAHAERLELKERVLAAIKALPEHERMVTTLFYVNGYTQADISDFLEVPVTTVAKRLYNARQRLKESMIKMFRDDLQDHRPSKDETFAEQVKASLRPLAEQDWEPVTALAYALEPAMREDDDLWLRNRQKFNEARYRRRHYVAEHAETQQILGYGAIEQGPFLPKYRLHLVVDPLWLRRGVGDLLLDQLMNDLRELKAITVWVRNYAYLTDLIDFLRERGFAETIMVWDMRWMVEETDVSSLLPVAEAVAARGIKITTVAEERERNPNCLRKLHEFLSPLWAEDPQRRPNTPFERTLRYFANPLVLADGAFIAMLNDRYIGYTDLNLMEALLGGVTQNFTGVVREYRRQGVATALKLRAFEYARQHGYRSIRAFNYPPQTAALALNEKLGFRRQYGYITLEKNLKEAIKVDPAIYEAYAGRYQLDPDFARSIPNEEDRLRLSSLVCTVTREGDRLIAETAGQRFELHPESETEFFIKEFYGRVTFIKDEKGQVTHVIHWEIDEAGDERELRFIALLS